MLEIFAFCAFFIVLLLFITKVITLKKFIKYLVVIAIILACAPMLYWIVKGFVAFWLFVIGFGIFIIFDSW